MHTPHPRPLVFTLLLTMLFLPTPARAQTFWTAGTGDWFTPANWSAGVPDQNGVANLDAVVANGGTAQLLAFGASVRRLRIGRQEGAGSLLLSGGGLDVDG